MVMEPAGSASERAGSVSEAKEQGGGGLGRVSKGLRGWGLEGSGGAGAWGDRTSVRSEIPPSVL